MSVLTVYPNPVILSKTGAIHNRGTVTLKNVSTSKCLFKVFFDIDVFCGISPAMGEINPGESRELKFSFEDTTRGDENVSFDIKYVQVLPETTIEEEIKLSQAPEEWANTVQAVIRFSTHTEDALKTVALSLKSKPSLTQVVKRAENRNIDVEQREMLERKVTEKRNQRGQLKDKIAALEAQIESQKEEMVKIASTTKTDYNLLMVGLIILLGSIVLRLFL